LHFSGCGPRSVLPSVLVFESLDEVELLLLPDVERCSGSEVDVVTESKSTGLFRVLVLRGLTIVACLGSATGLARNAGPAVNLSPVLPLGTSAPAQIPMLEEALRDPIVQKARIHDESDVERLVSELGQLKSELASRSKSELTGTLERIFEGYAVLSLYLADVSSGNIEAGRTTAETRARAQANLNGTRRELVRYAGLFAAATKSEKLASRALWHVHTTRWIMGENRSGQISALEKLKARTGKAKLSGALSNRATLLIAISQVDGSGRKRDQAIAVLKRIGSRDGNSNANAIAASLVVGRSLAGLNSRGGKIRKPETGYRGALVNASNRAATLPDARKSEVLSFIVSVWRISEGKGATWTKLPANLKHFAHLDLAKAIVERSAIEDAREKRLANATRKYQALANHYEGTATAAALELRTLDLHAIAYRASGSHAAYEQALLNARRKHGASTSENAEGTTSNGSSSLAAPLAARHQALVNQELGAASAKGAGAKDRAAAIQVATNWIESGVSAEENERVRARIGQLYAASGDHRSAVTVFLGLAEQNKSGKTAQYLSLAQNSQRQLAGWPASPPWLTVNGTQRAHTAEREQLAVIIQRQIDVSAKSGANGAGSVDWTLAAHLGLLQIALGNEATAFQLWETNLAASHSGPHAAQATGRMMKTWRDSGNWAGLEKIARFAREKNIAAINGKSSIDVRANLALALLEGGKAAIAANDFPTAVTKLTEFRTDFAGSARHDEGFYLLATAQRGAGAHEDSIRTLQEFVQQYPKSKFARQALLDGGDNAMLMAFEENVIWFYSRFMDNFGSDGEAIRVNTALYELHLGRGLFAEAAANLRWQMRVRQSSPEAKTLAVRSLMRLEEREGDLGRANAAANDVLRIASTDAGAVAEALHTQARFAASRKDRAQVERIEKRLASLDNSNPEVQEALGAVRFIIADSIGIAIAEEVFNLELKNPLATVNEQYAHFDSARRVYTRVCDGGRSSFCAAALFKTARLSETLIRAIEEVEIAPTLSVEEVSAFNTRKNSIMNEMAELAEASDNRSLAIVNEGYTNPDWTLAIMWHNARDWNFERVSGTTGNGFVQWTVGAQAASTQTGE